MGRAAIFQLHVLTQALVLLTLSWAISSPSAVADNVKNSLLINTGSATHAFNIEIANTPETRKTGLMGRQNLQANAGMLFTYPDSKIISMWMKNTYLSLDMIFADKDGQIRHITTNTQPLSEQIITSQVEAIAVLEVPAGTVERLQIKRGDWLIHPFFKNQPSP